MTAAEQKIVDTSLEHIRTLHGNISSMWDDSALASFYYSVLSGTIARNGPEVAQAIMSVLTEVYDNTTRSHKDLGKLTTGFGAKIQDQPTGPHS